MNRILVAVALTASLGTPLSSAPLDFLWSALSSFREAPASSKEGFGWDPNGIHSPPPAGTDAGFDWDPDGLNGDSSAPAICS
ncbi:MAG TPA: hypothetical protein VEL74_12845 [Thermoanaerobaculia bacterium]|nr:hypothetical protein [Thermoanaerobaculia bacterium]